MFQSRCDRFGMTTYSANSKTWRCYVGSVEDLMYDLPWWCTELERIVANSEEGDAMIRQYLDG